MFPNSYEFVWEPYRVVFLAFFLGAAVVIAGYVGAAVLRSWLDLRHGRAGALRWHDDFADLPPARRRCRHAIADTDGGRTCDHGFDCEHCAHHAAHETSLLTDTVHVHGLAVDPDCFYHRGHTWVRDEGEGRVMVGLSPLALRVLSPDHDLRAAQPGTELRRGDAAFVIEDESLRILAPVEGRVLERGSANGAPWLRLQVERPPSACAGLLRGTEAVEWLESELRQLQARVLGADAAAAWADGGAVVDDLPGSVPAADWRSLRQELFLDV